MADASKAIVNGAINYGLHIQNHSWGGGALNRTLNNAVRTAFINNSICIASRGNFTDTAPYYPSSLNDDWVISVGASGGDGKFKTKYNGDYSFQSQYAKDVDLIAPGSFYSSGATFAQDLDSIPIFTTNARGCFFNRYLFTSNYTGFNGTSASAPHVSGVAALMLSLHNVRRGYPNNLSIEDVEFILQKYATDITGMGTIDTVIDDPRYGLLRSTTNVIYGIGYDIYNGWGRLNAGASLRMIDTPRYQIFHPTAVPNTYNKILIRNGRVTLLDTISGLSEGTYNAEVYRAQESYTYNTATNWRIVDVWRRLSSSKGYADTTEIKDDPWMNFNALVNTGRNQVSVVANAYFYKISLPNGNFVWIPSNPDNQRNFHYSVHLENRAITSAEEIHNAAIKFSAFPNPTSGNIGIEYRLDALPSKIAIDIFDITGKLVQHMELPSSQSSIVTLDGQSLVKGTYIIKLTADNIYSYQKIIKL
jgi:subtilisin family serine protease